MKIVIAPNALKGSLSAHSAAVAMERGAKRALPNANVVLKPISDGVALISVLGSADAENVQGENEYCDIH